MFTGETEEESIDYDFKQRFMKLTEKIEKHKRAYEHFFEARKTLLTRYNNFCRQRKDDAEVEELLKWR